MAAAGRCRDRWQRGCGAGRGAGRGRGRGRRGSRGRFVEGVVPVPVLPRIGAVHLGHEVADEGLLVESSEVGAEEVVAGTEKAVVIHLWEE